MREILKLYTVDAAYINYLKEDTKLQPFIIDNKAGNDKFPRKYLGIVVNDNGKNYFIPFSSPKKSDYFINKEGVSKIRKNTLTIFRMTVVKKNDELELKGTLKLNNMIPVPQLALSEYKIKDEKNLDYKDIVQKEYTYIKQKINVISKNAKVLYKQKMNETEFGKNKPNYLNSTVPFKYAEEKCIEYCRQNQLEVPTLKDQNIENEQQEDKRKPLDEQLHDARQQTKDKVTGNEENQKSSINKIEHTR